MISGNFKELNFTLRQSFNIKICSLTFADVHDHAACIAVVDLEGRVLTESFWLDSSTEKY